MPKPRVLDWHRQLARIVGRLSLSISEQRISKIELEIWARELMALSKEMMEAMKTTRRATPERDDE